MKKACLFLLILPCMLIAQSPNGDGKMIGEKPTGLRDTPRYQGLSGSTFFEQGNKLKKGEPLRILEWFDLMLNDVTHRYRRDFKKDSHFYDEDLLALTSEQIDSEEFMDAYTHSVQFDGSNIRIATEMDDERVMVYSEVKVYDPYNGLLQSTIYFEKGRPVRINMNHYYSNNQLQFVREITSDGMGEPLRNVGVLEAYYPDGSVFENPITEDGTAIIILNDAGEVEDQCACMGEDILTWGRGYLYTFLGKYTILIEQIYQDEGMECCWE